MYPQVFGKYILERELARGGMARVVLATLRGAGGFEKKLVVKQIRDELAYDAEFVRRFVAEAKTTVALSHPNIVPVYELGMEQGTYFLAMELVEGLSVAELLKETKRLAPYEGAYVGVEICRALEYAHRRMNVVHRDITPRNVMVDEEGQVKVIDFGIAAPADVSSHEVFGSPGHMPPEQARGEELGPATDIFAVAALLMEAWSGVAPFRRATPAECDAAIQAPHPRPSAIDIRLLPLDEVVGRAMSIDPRARPQDAEELGKALRRFLAGIDLGDIARGLAEKVRDARSTPAADDPDARTSAPPPPSTSPSDVRTQTFAARKEVSTWATSEPSPPKPRTPPSMDPQTHAMPKSMPPPPRVPAVIEGGAARPHEPSIVTNRRSRLGLLGLAAAGVAAIAVLGAPILRQATTVAPPRALPAPPLAITAPAPLAPAPSEVPVTSAVAPASPPPVPSPSAHLSLIGDPGTRVSIDAAPRGACPLRDIALASGPHDVRFTFEPTGESSGERVTLRPGEHVTLRADFAGASPTIRVAR